MEEPKISNIQNKENGIFTFDIDNCNVSIINSLRRCILTEIPVYVFKGFPYEDSQINVIKNTSRFHNEIIKQRLGCIPIMIKPKDEPFDITQYKFVIEKNNNTNQTMYITTKDIQIVRIEDGVKIKETIRDQIFPPNKITNDYILLLRLQPQVSSDIEPEEIHIEMNATIGKAKEDGMFNAVSLCSYNNRINELLIEPEREKYLEKIKKYTEDEKTIEQEMKNWNIHNKHKLIHKDKFTMNIETISVYSNYELWNTACNIMNNKLDLLIEQSQEETLGIEYQLGTTHSFYVRLENEDYTLGKVLEYMIYVLEYQQQKHTNKLILVNFFKNHPLNKYGILRIDFIKQSQSTEEIKMYKDLMIKIIQENSQILKSLYENIKFPRV